MIYDGKSAEDPRQEENIRNSEENKIQLPQRTIVRLIFIFSKGTMEKTRNCYLKGNSIPKIMLLLKISFINLCRIKDFFKIKSSKIIH